MNPIFGMKGGSNSTTGRFCVNIGYEGKSYAEVSRFVEGVPKVLLDNLTPFWTKIKPIISASISNSFATEGHGKWQKLSETYLKSKKKRESKYPNAILKLTGTMWRAATEEGADGNYTLLTKDHMVWGINLEHIPYARRHDMGWQPVPQREFMRLYPDDMPKITASMANYVRAGVIAARQLARETK